MIYLEQEINRRKFSKGETTDWSYEINSFTQITDDSIPSYWMNFSPESHIEALKKKQIWNWKKIKKCWKN